MDTRFMVAFDCVVQGIVKTLIVKVELERGAMGRTQAKCMCMWVAPKENTQSFPKKRTRACIEGHGFKT